MTRVTVGGAPLDDTKIPTLSTNDSLACAARTTGL